MCFFVLTCRIVTGRTPKVVPARRFGHRFELPKCTFWHHCDPMGHRFQLRFDFIRRATAREGNKRRTCDFATLPRFGLVLAVRGALGVPLGDPGGLFGGP